MKLRIFSVVICAILMFCSSLFAGTRTITLGWNYPTDVADLEGFRIYQSNTSGQYGSTPAMTITDTSARQATLPSPLPDGNYFWVMTAFDKGGNESAKSTELAYTLDATPPPVPVALKVVVTVVTQ